MEKFFNFKNLSKLLLLAIVIGIAINFIPVSKNNIPVSLKLFINQGIGSIFWTWFSIPFKVNCLKTY